MTVTDRIEREPVGFAGAVKATLLALVPLAILFGWDPTEEEATQALAAVASVAVAVELWATWWVRAAVTPEVAVVAREREALAAGHAAGREAASIQLLELDAARLAAAPPARKSAR